MSTPNLQPCLTSACVLCVNDFPYMVVHSTDVATISAVVVNTLIPLLQKTQGGPVHWEGSIYFSDRQFVAGKSRFIHYHYVPEVRP